MFLFEVRDHNDGIAKQTEDFLDGAIEARNPGSHGDESVRRINYNRFWEKQSGYARQSARL
jgi:hypothetical protein